MDNGKQIWVLRNSKGETIGCAPATDKGEAVNQAMRMNRLTHDTAWLLLVNIRHDAPLPHGYTLQLEPLRAPLSDADCDAIRHAVIYALHDLRGMLPGPEYDNAINAAIRQAAGT